MKVLSRFLLVFAIVAAQQPTFAQVGSPLPIAHIQLSDVNGVPLAGGFVYTCVAGTACAASTLGGPPSNPLISYSDAIGTLNTNPIVLDASGSANLLGGTAAYKIVIQDANGVQQWSLDNVSSPNAAIAALGVSLLASLAGTGGAALIGTSVPGGGLRTAASKLAETHSVLDYQGVGDGVTDDRVAIQNGLNALASTCGTLVFPAGYTFLINSNPTNTTLLTYPPCVSMEGPGKILLGSGLGNFQSLFYCAAALQPARIAHLVIDMNGAGNSISTNPTPANYQMIFWFISAVAGSGVSFVGNTFMNGHGVWTINTYSTNILITGNRWTNWGVGVTLAGGFDASNIYLGSGYSVVTDNTMQGAGILAHTGIEVHGSNDVVSGNIIVGFEVGVIYDPDVVGVGTAHNVTIANNTVDLCYYGIYFWTFDAPVENLTIVGNVVTVDRNSEPWVPNGNESGIAWYPGSTFSVESLAITGNTVHFNPDATTTITNGGDSAGISIVGGAPIHGATVTGNTIDSPFATGILVTAPEADAVNVSGNTVINPGQSAYSGLAADFKTGITVAGTAVWKGSAFRNNVITDNQATPTMQRGIEWAGTAGDGAGKQVSVTRNLVSYSGTPNEYYQISFSSPYFELDVPGYASNSALLGLTALTAGNFPPRAAQITDTLTGRVWRNENTYSDPLYYFSSQEWRDTVPTTGSYNVGDIVWAVDAAAGGFAAWINVVTGTPGTFWKVPAAIGGYTGVKNLTGSVGGACTETFAVGIMTASTCP